MLEPPCVIPVSHQDAIDWAFGRLNDSDLLLNAPLVPEAVFIVSMHGVKKYREAIRQVLYWRDRGAVFMIMRTASFTVDAHIIAGGGEATFREPPRGNQTSCRFILPPDAFKTWLGRVTKHARTSPGDSSIGG